MHYYGSSYNARRCVTIYLVSADTQVQESESVSRRKKGYRDICIFYPVYVDVQIQVIEEQAGRT